ncbi:hypothetical protein [Bacillus sp. Marseille-Q3570]|uniref:hypothetical protein n=1 Tax=Bacillus sp. Marseille-Q3570 TaxID=2963522 RepID=UPI0021B7136A|nr:hypothetical protein [Bacillus sp. Marseille-Q3570]
MWWGVINANSEYIGAKYGNIGVKYKSIGAKFGDNDANSKYIGRNPNLSIYQY